jgi:hypothetical protein
VKMKEGVHHVQVTTQHEASYMTATEPTSVEQIACMFRQVCDKLRDDCKTKNVTVVPPRQE